jgi:hypothetical protein
LDEELYHFPNGISRSNFAVNSGDSQLCLDCIEISARYFDFDRGDIPALMPSETRLFFVVDSFLHRNLDVELGLGFILLELDCIFRLQNLKDLVLVLFARSLESEVAIHPSPFFALLLHLYLLF